MLTGYVLGMELGMDLASPSFGRNFGPDIRLDGIIGTTNGQTYKKKGSRGMDSSGERMDMCIFLSLERSQCGFPDGYPIQPAWKTPQAHPNDIHGL